MAILAVSNVTREPSQVPLVPTRPSPIRVAVADDSFLMRDAVTQVLERHGGVEVVAACADGESLLAAVERERPDVVVTDCACRRRATTKGSASRSGCASGGRRSASSS